MSALGEETSTLVAREVAALRRQGLPAAQAVSLVAEGLPPGPLRERLSQLASQLSAGAPAQAGDELLLSLLARGEAAGPQALLEAAHAFQLRGEARAAWRRAVILPAALLGGGVLLLMTGGFVLENAGPIRELIDLGPGISDLTLQVMLAARWFGPVLLLALAAGLRGAPAEWMPGVRGLNAAARLRAFAAALQAGLPEPEAAKAAGLGAYKALFEAPGLGLDPLEQALGARMLTWKGPAWASAALATEMEAQGARAAMRFNHAAPLLGVLAFVVFAGPILASLLLPLFSLARSIQ